MSSNEANTPVVVKNKTIIKIDIEMARKMMRSVFTDASYILAKK